MKKLLLLKLLLLGFLFTKAQSTSQNYINKYKDLAISQMNEHGIPASVTLAVAMHESASGTSKIARHLNNHFGIKGRNQVKRIRSAYKSYDSVANSYADFVRMLQSRAAFSKLFNRYSAYDYKNWVRGIQRGGYAHSKTWGSQVLGFIRKYQLYQYDKRPDTAAPDSLSTDSLASDSLTVVAAEETPVAVIRIYRVKKGDTLSGIAKRLHTSVKVLMKKNHLKSTRLKLGQKLKY
ncbi:MAG: glucosaminidase domain-containing protein [Sphingobacteriaceae bacterium]